MTFHFTRTAFLNHFEFPALFWRARNRRGKVKKLIQEVFYATLVTFLKKGKLQSKILKQKKKAVLIDIFDSSKQHSRSNQYSNNEKRKLRPSPIFYFQIVSSVIHLAPAKIFKSKNCRISCQKDQISRVQLSKDQLSKDQLSSSHTINLHETYLSSLTISLKRRHLFLY